MSARWIDYFESYGIPHDDNAKEYVESDDFLVKGKYNFMAKNFKLSAKTRFFTDKAGNYSSALDYTLTHNVSKNSSYKVIHKPERVTLDGNFNLFNKDNLSVSLFTNANLAQNDKSRELPAKLSLRFHHEDNKIFGFGVEDFDPIFGACPAPKIVTAFGLFGTPKIEGFRFFGGPNFGFGVASRSLQYQRYLMGVKGDKLTAYLELNVTRKVNTSVDKEQKTVETVTHPLELSVRFDSDPVKDVKVGGDLVYNLESHKVDAKIFGQYSIDNSTFVKAKVQTDNSFTLALVHNYRGLVNFGFNSRFVLDKSRKEGDLTTLTNVKTKFGLVAEFNETS